jgi:hypothetical protein
LDLFGDKPKKPQRLVLPSELVAGEDPATARIKSKPLQEIFPHEAKPLEVEVPNGRARWIKEGAWCCLEKSDILYIDGVFVDTVKLLDMNGVYYGVFTIDEIRRIEIDRVKTFRKDLKEKLIFLDKVLPKDE